MPLSNLQRTNIEKALAGGNSDFAVNLTDADACYLLAVIARDLGLQDKFPELPRLEADYYDLPLRGVPVGKASFWPLVNRLVALDPNTDSYFTCLGKMHRSRLKYGAILQRQPLPTMNQVGPRGLLQFGTMTPAALTALMFWRKWIYDIDNRAAQETGYLFEPILASAVGGSPASARSSPVKRRSKPTEGRQVDCIREKTAYEFKLRITIAASGQGRWKEELDFAADANASGYRPVLVVFDDTRNDKLDAITKAFQASGGDVHIGEAAWVHLDSVAGPTMANFIERYVRLPIQAMLEAAPGPVLPSLSLSMDGNSVVIVVGGERYELHRQPGEPEED